MDDYEVTMLVKVKVYAASKGNAVRQAARLTTLWDDCDFIREENVKCLSDNPHDPQ